MSGPTPPLAVSRARRRLARAVAAFVFALLVLALMTFTVLWPETDSTGEPSSKLQRDSFTFPSGEIIVNEFQTHYGSEDDEIHERLFFQANTTVAPELMVNLVSDERHFALSGLPESPQIIRDGPHLAIVLGPHIFERWTNKHGPYWFETNTAPAHAAVDFLHSFLNPGDPGLNQPDPAEWAFSHALPYVFDHLDYAQNVLVTRLQASLPPLPQYLAYSVSVYGCERPFDLERTRALNHLPPPSDTRYGLDVSVVVCPGTPVGPAALGRAGILALPGTREMLHQSLPLKGSAWSVFAGNLSLPGSVPGVESFDYMLACVDSLSPHVSVLWRQHENPFYNWDYVPLGTWTIADQSGFTGNISRFIFIRVREL